MSEFDGNSGHFIELFNRSHRHFPCATVARVAEKERSRLKQRHTGTKWLTGLILASLESHYKSCERVEIACDQSGSHVRQKKGEETKRSRLIRKLL